MKVFVITRSTSASNIVKGALQQANVEDVEVHACPNAQKALEAVDENSIVFVDWEGDPDPLANEVAHIKSAENGKDATVLLLCTKQASASTFQGMKAGAGGVVTKPVEPAELVKAIAAARKRVKAKKAPNINVEFINPFIEATRTVLGTMASLQVERKKLFLKDDYNMYGDISGVMGLSGAATGSVVISLPTKLAIEVVSTMLGEEPVAEITPAISDGVGEIINMISGQAKASLTKTKYHFQISLPTVVMGTNHQITHKQGTPNIVVVFETEKGNTFAIQVCLSPNDEE